MPSTTIPIDVTTVSTSKQLPLGYVYLEPAKFGVGATTDVGEKEWVYVFNDEASTALAVGDIVIRDPSATTQKEFGVLIAPLTNDAVAHSVVGVAQHAIPAGSYGFVQRKGKCLVKNGTGNITADTPIVSGGSRAGSARDMTNGEEMSVFGFSLEAEATDDTTFDAWINCPGS